MSVSKRRYREYSSSIGITPKMYDPGPLMPPEGGAPLRLVIAGDVRLYRDGIAQVLNSIAEFDVRDATSGVAASLESVRGHSADVLVVDMAMPGSLELVRQVDEADVAVVALALPETESTFLTCVEAGIASYVAREATVEDLAEAIRAAVCGELKLDPRLAGCLARRVSALSTRMGSPEEEFELTPRETEIARLIAAGKSNKRISAELHIALATVKNHVHNILRKMGAKGRADIAVRWARQRMQEPPALRARRNLDHVRGRQKEPG